MELTIQEALAHEKIADSGKELVEYFVEHRFPVVDLGNGITATRATQADVSQAEALRQTAWVESYGNDAIGITSEMIQKRFAGKSEQNIALLSQMIAEGKNILVVKENDKII